MPHRHTIHRHPVAHIAPAWFGRWSRVPLKPFAGTIGLAPAEAGLHSGIPPRRVGGNMDIRDLAQGDGEVCGTAIGSPMRAARRSMIDLLMREHGMPAIDAYLLCSVCADLRIGEIVDLPNWIVSCYFPRVIFD